MIQTTITMKENELPIKNLKETSTSLNLKMASLVWRTAVYIATWTHAYNVCFRSTTSEITYFSSNTTPLQTRIVWTTNKTTSIRCKTSLPQHLLMKEVKDNILIQLGLRIWLRRSSFLWCNTIAMSFSCISWVVCRIRKHLWVKLSLMEMCQLKMLKGQSLKYKTNISRQTRQW